jgi:SAM-dependent methyltransferase
VELRERARDKFSRAGEMYFTRRRLEQATEERIADYKASRLPMGGRFADLCCGLGGDLLSWAARGNCLGVDLDPTAVLLARANAAALGITTCDVEVLDAAAAPVEGAQAWHADPDRRPGGHRTTQLEAFQPDRGVLERLLSRQPGGAIKLAPATRLPASWSGQSEREWIGSRRECRQQVAWFGPLAQYPGRRRATVVDRGGHAHGLVGSSATPIPVTQRVGQYIYDPHAAVLAAQLAGELCRRHELAALHVESGYLTGDRLVAGPLIAAFTVLEVLPFDARVLRSALRQRQVGRLEIKVRGVRVDPAELARTLKPQGDRECTLLIIGPEHGIGAVLAQRLDKTG